MGTKDGIKDLLEKIFGGISGDLTEINNNLVMSPADAFGNDFWETLLNIGAKVFMPFALTILGFFVAAEFYNLYCRTNGEIDMQLVSTTCFKFLLPFLLINRTYDLINWSFKMFNKLISDLSSAYIVENTQNGADAVTEIMKLVNKMNWGERMGIWFELIFVYFGIKIMKTAIFIIVYGRLFEIMLFWIVSPLPFATLVHNEHSQIGKNFIKMFLALVFQGVLIFLFVLMYSKLTQTIITDDISGSVWQILGYSAILIFCLGKTGTISKRIFGTF